MAFFFFHFFQIFKIFSFFFFNILWTRRNIPTWENHVFRVFPFWNDIPRRWGSDLRTATLCKGKTLAPSHTRMRGRSLPRFRQAGAMERVPCHRAESLAEAGGPQTAAGLSASLPPDLSPLGAQTPDAKLGLEPGAGRCRLMSITAQFQRCHQRVN